MPIALDDLVDCIRLGQGIGKAGVVLRNAVPACHTRCQLLLRTWGWLVTAVPARRVGQTVT